MCPSPYRSDVTQRIQDEELDSFGHRDYVSAIESALADAPSQFTLGLFGPWGSGKSTILEELSRRLNGEASGTVLVVFDAWRYDGDSLRREFIRTVAQQLKDQRALPKSLRVSRFMETFELDVTRPRDTTPRITLATLLSAGLSALIVLAVIGMLYGLVALFDPDNHTTAKGAIAVLGPLVAFILVVAGRLVSPVQIQEASKRREFPEQFAARFGELLSQVTVGRVVIAVDNLDRCSPTRVAEVLTTIKTFLEPALKDQPKSAVKSLCFVIAADDEALRRHMIAQELDASPTAPMATGSAHQGAEEGDSETGVDPIQLARQATDEYLRKFFSGSIRLTEVLDEDMRNFSRRELSDFISCHEEIEDKQVNKLVGMTALALKKNPRRVKQFINNLELRLQLYAKRHPRHIQMKADPLVVAKLVIIEEEFPDEHQALRRRPDLWNAWHEAAEQIPEGELDRDLLGLLRFTSDVDSPHIAAYITMKQTKAELELPGYAEFVSKLAEARVQELEAELQDMSAHDVGRHAAAAESYFDQEVDELAWAGAHGTVRSVLEVPQLRAINSLVEHVFGRSIQEPELKARLSELRPELLLDVGLERDDPPARQVVVDMLVEAIQGADVSPERRRAVCDAFAAEASQLKEEERAAIKQGFQDPQLRSAFPTYVRLVEVLPELIDSTMVSDALDELRDMPDVEGSDPRLAVATTSSVVLSSEPDLVHRLLEILAAALATLRGEDWHRFSGLATRVIVVLPLAGTDEYLATIAGEIAQHWNDIPVNAQGSALELGRAICVQSPKADEQHGEAIGRNALEGQVGPSLSRWISDNAASIPAGVLSGLRSGLVERLAAGEDDVVRSAVEALDSQNRTAVLSRAALAAAEESAYSRTEELMGELDEESQLPVLDVVAEHLRTRPVATIDAGGVELLVEHQEAFGARRVDDLATWLVDTMMERRGKAPRLGPLIGKMHVEREDLRQSLVVKLVEFERGVSNINRREGYLKAAHGLVRETDGPALAELEARLEQLHSMGGDDGDLAQRVAL